MMTSRGIRAGRALVRAAALAAIAAGAEASIDPSAAHREPAAEKPLMGLGAAPLDALSGLRPSKERAAFVETERALQSRIRSSALSNEPDWRGPFDLSIFYAANDLWAEADTALKAIDAERLLADERAFAAYAAFRAGRDRRVVALLAGQSRLAADESLVLAATMSRLGSYDAALSALESIVWDAVSGRLAEDTEIQYALLMARAMADGGGERQGLDAALQSFDFTEPGKALIRLLSARATHGDADQRTIELARRAVAETGAPSAAAARLAILLAETLWASGETPAAAAIEAVKAARLSASAEDVRREADWVLGRIHLGTGEMREGMTHLRRLVERHPESDAAREGGKMITEVMPRLFASARAGGNGDFDRIALFLDYLDFAPPGAEGDDLIRQAATHFAGHGLFREADQLLEHQAFKRLRGPARARVAADLAELRLGADAPKEALDALARSRLVGLDDDLSERRLLLEAAALGALGRHDRALVLIDGAPGERLALMRADLAWRMGDFALAGSQYEIIMGSEHPGDAPLRAGLAYLLSGNQERARGVRDRIASERSADNATLELLDALLDAEDPTMLMDAYRNLRSSGASKV